MGVGDDHVGVHRKLESTAERKAFYTRDYWHRAISDSSPQALGVALIDLDGAEPRHVFEVGARTEVAAFARNEDAAHLLVQGQLPKHLCRHCQKESG